jgi:hypothetical protein
LLIYTGLSALAVREIKKTMKRENTLEIIPLDSRKDDFKAER